MSRLRELVFALEMLIAAAVAAGPASATVDEIVKINI